MKYKKEKEQYKNKITTNCKEYNDNMDCIIKNIEQMEHKYKKKEREYEEMIIKQNEKMYILKNRVKDWQEMCMEFEDEINLVEEFKDENKRLRNRNISLLEKVGYLQRELSNVE